MNTTQTQQIAAEDIKAGDRFDHNGNGWVALSDARKVRQNGDTYIEVMVAYFPDGGRSARYFDTGKTLPIQREN